MVCNGCTDTTAELARRAGPWATVLELEEPSKTAALQAGDEAVQAFPRLYLDGDITIKADGVRRLRQYLLEAELEGVAPTPRYEMADATPIVRSHYRWWTAMQATSKVLTSSGAIMVRADVRRRFDQWPNVLADDYFLDGVINLDAKGRLDDVTVTVRPPRRFTECVSRRARVWGGNREVSNLRLRHEGSSRSRSRTIFEMVRARPALLLARACPRLGCRQRVGRGHVASSARDGSPLLSR